MTRIAITGAAGRMGRALIEAGNIADGVEVTVAIERCGSSVIGADAGELAGIGTPGVRVGDNRAAATNDFDVFFDFTRPDVTLANLKICREAGKRRRAVRAGRERLMTMRQAVRNEALLSGDGGI